MTKPDAAKRAILRETLAECLALIDGAGKRSVAEQSPNTEDLPSLLERCRGRSDQVAAVQKPIRTLHHFACTGGTLISKCLASMPNTQLISEVEPFSEFPGAKHQFSPTDLVMLVRSSSRGGDTSLEQRMFLASLFELNAFCVQAGYRLILRDHPHSRYCVGRFLSEKPSLLELVSRQHAVRSILTIRHPIDSFLSLREMNWMHFQPATLEEYCTRYLCFLDEHSDLATFKYEDFAEQPQTQMQAMCDELALPYSADFIDTFPVHQLSGDSGRSSSVISPRERRPVDDELRAAAENSGAFNALCLRLGYSASF